MIEYDISKISRSPDFSPSPGRPDAAPLRTPALRLCLVARTHTGTLVLRAAGGGMVMPTTQGMLRSEAAIVAPAAAATKHDSIVGLPGDCIDAIYRTLDLKEAMILSSTCTSLRKAIRRNLPALRSVLCFSNSTITDAVLLRLCKEARGEARVLSITGCHRLTREGLILAVREVGPTLMSFDLSAMSRDVVDDDCLVAMAPWLPGLRVLRIAFLGGLSSDVVIKLQQVQFGKQLRTIDVSYSPHVFCFEATKFPCLQAVIATGCKHTIGTFHAPPMDYPAVSDTPEAYPISATAVLTFGNVWEYVEADDLERVVSMAELFWKPLRDVDSEKMNAAMVKQVPSAWMKSLAWNDHSRTGLNECKPFPKHRELTTLAAHAAHHQAGRVTRFLVQQCGADPLAGRENAMLTKALLASTETGSNAVDMNSNISIVNELVPRHGLSFVQPVAVAVLVLAAAKRDAGALSAFCPLSTSSFTNSAGAVQRTSAALAAALRAVFNPPSRICFPTAEVAVQVWNAEWYKETGFKSSWLSSTLVHTGANLPNYCVSLPDTGVHPGAEAFLINTGEVVRVLLQRGALYDEGVALRAAQLGEWHALQVLLFAGTDVVEVDLGPDELDAAVRQHAQLIVQRLLPQRHRKCSMLVAVAKCNVPALADWTLEGLMDMLFTVEDVLIKSLLTSSHNPNKHANDVGCLFHSDEFESCGPDASSEPIGFRVPFPEMIDEDAARAVLMALDCGNYNAAHRILELRRGTLRKLATSHTYANQALHVVARAVGRGHGEDRVLIAIGRTIITEARTVKAGPLADWLSEELVDKPGRTLLHYACGGSVPAFAEFLLAEGAAVDAVDDDGATPLCLAVESHASRACLETLLRAGGKVDAVDKRCRTALHRAAEVRNASGAATLLRWGADPMKRDVFDIAPAHIDTDLLRRASMFAQGDGEGTLPFDIMK